jgi:hypothetical protein
MCVPMSSRFRAGRSKPGIAIQEAVERVSGGEGASSAADRPHPIAEP